MALDALRGERRNLYVGLAVAILLHVALLASVIARMPSEEERRRVGEKSGALDGVAVLLVDEADLKSRATVPFEGQSRPQPKPAEKPAAQAQPQPEQQQQPPQPQPPQKEAEHPAEKPVEKAVEPQKESVAALAKEMPDLLAVPEPGKPPPKSEAKPQRQQQQQPQAQPPAQPQPRQQPQQKQTASLNPSPKSKDDLVFDGSAAFSRPAGITRSGENDDFGRGVIRALRQTMPPPHGSRGRVTIRFLLSETGSLVEVRVVATNADPVLTQNVVFASKQSNFPIPPTGATVVDRTFLVTYIYD